VTTEVELPATADLKTDAARGGRAAPGWDALIAAVSPLFPGQRPHHVAGSELPTGGLTGVDVLRDEDTWLFLTLGFSSLFEKNPGEDPAWSGWGFELTLRVPQQRDAEPPAWAPTLLGHLHEYVEDSGNTLVAGQRMQLHGITTDTGDSLPDAVAFAPDPRLLSADTPHGRVEFVTVVGITTDELIRMKSTSTEAVLARLATVSPLLVTDPARAATPAAAPRRWWRRGD
jgi:hypothetical protein